CYGRPRECSPRVGIRRSARPDAATSWLCPCRPFLVALLRYEPGRFLFGSQLNLPGASARPRACRLLGGKHLNLRPRHCASLRPHCSSSPPRRVLLPSNSSELRQILEPYGCCSEEVDQSTYLRNNRVGCVTLDYLGRKEAQQAF